MGRIILAGTAALEVMTANVSPATKDNKASLRILKRTLKAHQVDYVRKESETGK
jgi:hypothetical protein